MICCIVQVVLFWFSVLAMGHGGQDQQIDDMEVPAIRSVDMHPMLNGFYVNRLADNIGRPQPRQTEGVDRYLERVKAYCMSLSYLQMVHSSIRHSIEHHDEVKWCKDIQHKVTLLKRLWPALTLGQDAEILFENRFYFRQIHLTNDQLQSYIVGQLFQYYRDKGVFDLTVSYIDLCVSFREKLTSLSQALSWIPFYIHCTDHQSSVGQFRLNFLSIGNQPRQPRNHKVYQLVLADDQLPRLQLWKTQEEELENEISGEQRPHPVTVKFMFQLELDFSAADLYENLFTVAFSSELRTIFQSRFLALSITVAQQVSLHQMKMLAEFVVSSNLLDGSKVSLTIKNGDQHLQLGSDQISNILRAFYSRIPPTIQVAPVRYYHSILLHNGRQYEQQILTQQLYAQSQRPGMHISITHYQQCQEFSTILDNLSRLLVQNSRDYIYYGVKAKKVDSILDLTLSLNEVTQFSDKSCLLTHLLPALKSVPIKNVQIFIKYFGWQPFLETINVKLAAVDPSQTKVVIYVPGADRTSFLMQDYQLEAANYPIRGQLF
ncbi:hypothetical protein MIR68_001257 [Amoeboaphelidium protococcarum]|nr:hypothetical protein MIR68_001257 [Amoeboaphelidium protococcarum]